MEVDNTHSADSYSSSESESELSESEVETDSCESTSSDCESSAYSTSDIGSSSSLCESDSNSGASDSSVDSDASDKEETPALKRLAEFRVPLYDSANITILESYLLLYQFALRHSLSKKALSDLLSVLNVHLPEQARSAPSFYRFFQVHFCDIDSTLKYYCPTCHRPLDSNDSSCPNGCGSSVSTFTFLLSRD